MLNLKYRITHAQVGFTLIEVMIVVVIAAILLALAIPAFQDTIDRNRLKSVAETILSDLELMKLESVKRSQSVFLSIRNDDAAVGDWCYGMRNSASCDCKSTTCTIDGISKIVSYNDFKGVKITAPATTSPTPHDLWVEQVRGTIDWTSRAPTTYDYRIRMTSARGKELDIEVSTLGRFRICSPSGSSNVFGYPTCS